MQALGFLYSSLPKARQWEEQPSSSIPAASEDILMSLTFQPSPSINSLQNSRQSHTASAVGYVAVTRAEMQLGGKRWSPSGAPSGTHFAGRGEASNAEAALLGVLGHHQRLVLAPASPHSAFSCWCAQWLRFSVASRDVLVTSYYPQVLSRAIASQHPIFCLVHVLQLWCKTLPLAIVQIMLSRRLIFLNYTNQPVQVICPSVI